VGILVVRAGEIENRAIRIERTKKTAGFLIRRFFRIWLEQRALTFLRRGGRKVPKIEVSANDHGRIVAEEMGYAQNEVVAECVLQTLVLAGVFRHLCLEVPVNTRVSYCF
jgi:hypothetical protein